MSGVLTASQVMLLRRELLPRKRAVCFGAGVDSTAMLIAGNNALDMRACA